MRSSIFVNGIDLELLSTKLIDDTNIPYVTHARSLGVILQSNLSWSKHISNIYIRVHATLYRLKFHKNALPTRSKIKLVTSLVLPIFDYCCLVYNDVTVNQNIKLQRLLNCAIRFIYNLNRDEHITRYRKKLNWLKVEDRRLDFVGIMIYKILAVCLYSSSAHYFVFLK